MYVTVEKRLTTLSASLWIFKGTEDECKLFLKQPDFVWKRYRKRLPRSLLLRTAKKLRIQAEILFRLKYTDESEKLFTESRHLREKAFRIKILNPSKAFKFKHKPFTKFYDESNQN